MPERRPTPPLRNAKPTTGELGRLRQRVRALEADNARLAEAARLAAELQGTLQELRNQQEEVQIQNHQLAESQRLLEESRDRYADLFESAPTAFVGLDFNGVIREVNSMACELLGTLRGRLLETPMVLFIDEPYRRGFLDFIRGCRQGVRPKLDLVLKLRNNQRVPVELCSSTGTGLDAVSVRYQIALTDLTERKHAVEVREKLTATQANEQLLRTVLDTLPVGVRVVNRGGQIVMQNAASQEIWGDHPSKDGPWWTGLLAWRNGSDRPLYLDEWPIARVLAGGKPILSERMTIQTGDGVNKTIHASALPLRNEGGAITGAVSVHEDITALLKVQAALRLSETKARKLINSNIMGVVFFNGNGVIIEANDAFLNLTGYSQADIDEGSVQWTDLTPADSLPLAERSLNEIRTRGKIEPRELVCHRKDAVAFYALVGGSMLEGSDEGVAFVLDISDRKRAEGELRKAKEAAEAANELKDQFLSTVSHELRTPLSSVLLWTHLLRRGILKQEEERTEALDTIHHSAKAQSRLIDDLLDVSRIMSGKLQLELREEPVGPVIEAAVQLCQPAAAIKHITLTTEIDRNAGTAAMDRQRIEQVASNLLSNAVKFTPEKGAISVQVTGAGGFVRLVVADNGIGITPDFLPHVFERFRQAEASLTRSYGGLGLGLSITRDLVHLHGGTIRAESEGLGKGSRFTVELPTVQSLAETGTAADAPTSDAASPMLSLSGVRILVVEDDLRTREALAKILAGRGALVKAVGSAAGAIRSFRHRRPDVLVSDLGMPGEDGLSLMRRLRETERNADGITGLSRSRKAARLPPIPAIALTAFARKEDEQQALAAGFQAHVAKPTDPNVLVSLVARLAKRRAARVIEG